MNVSYSQYSTWKNCGWAWKLKYVDGHREDTDSIHTVFGTAMHEVIQDWLDTLYNKSEVIAKSVYLHDTFKEKLLSLFKEKSSVNEEGETIFLCDRETLMMFYTQGCAILDYIQQHHKKIFPTTNVKLHSIEFPLEIDLTDEIQYIGFVDIITVNELTNKYVLYDLKTSTRGWRDYQKKDPVKSGQLLLYKIFFSQQQNIPLEDISVEYIILKRQIVESSLYHIPRVSKFSPSHGKPSINKKWAMFSEFIKECFDENGEYISEQIPSPSKNSCRFCEFKDGLCAYAWNE